MGESFLAKPDSSKQKKFASLYEAAEKVSKEIHSQMQKEACLEEIMKIAESTQNSENKVDEIKKIIHSQVRSRVR